MNFQQLRFVLAVQETGSFTKAADQCCVTQPALSNAIAQLEDELGAKLFTRTTRSVTLTDFGQSLVADIERIMSAKSRLLQRAADLNSSSSKTVRIGVSPIISNDFIQTLLARAAQTDPELRVILSELNRADIAPALSAGEIDFGFGPSSLAAEGLVSAPIYSEPLLVVRDRRINAVTGPRRLEELTDEVVMFVHADCGLADVTRTLFHANDIAIRAYEGRALSYAILERWTRFGIGVC
nr:LysR family transcriptional regulator [Paracoccaceae bacterium]